MAVGMLLLHCCCFCYSAHVDLDAATGDVHVCLSCVGVPVLFCSLFVLVLLVLLLMLLLVVLARC